MKEFAKRLKEYQMKNNITQGQLAEKAGVSQGTISAYMRDAKNPTLDMLAEISKRLGVTIGWLCGEDTTPTEIKTYADAMRTIANLCSALGYGIEIIERNYEYEGKQTISLDITDSTIIRFLRDYKKLFDAIGSIKDLPVDVLESWIDTQCKKYENEPINDLLEIGW